MARYYEIVVGAAGGFEICAVFKRWQKAAFRNFVFQSDYLCFGRG